MKKELKSKKKTKVWRRVTPEETEYFRQAINNTFGTSLPPHPLGRPPKDPGDKFKPVSIRLHPAVLEWAKREAKKRGVGYQTVINEALLKLAA